MLEHVEQLDLIEEQTTRIVLFEWAGETRDAGLRGTRGFALAGLDAVCVDAELLPQERERFSTLATDFEHARARGRVRELARALRLELMGSADDIARLGPPGATKLPSAMTTPTLL